MKSFCFVCYDVVWVSWMLSILLSMRNRLLSNCLPWSEVMRVGIPNREIKFAMRAFAIVSADMSAIGLLQASV